MRQSLLVGSLAGNTLLCPWRESGCAVHRWAIQVLCERVHAACHPAWVPPLNTVPVPGQGKALSMRCTASSWLALKTAAHAQPATEQMLAACCSRVSRSPLVLECSECLSRRHDVVQLQHLLWSGSHADLAGHAGLTASIFSGLYVGFFSPDAIRWGISHQPSDTQGLSLHSAACIPAQSLKASPSAGPSLSSGSCCAWPSCPQRSHCAQPLSLIMFLLSNRVRSTWRARLSQQVRNRQLYKQLLWPRLHTA